MIHVRYLMVFLFLVAATAAADEDRSQILAKLHKVPDEQIHARLERLLATDDFRRKAEYDACLTELVRRGVTPADAPRLAALIAEGLRTDDPTDVATRTAQIRGEFTGMHYIRD